MSGIKQSELIKLVGLASTDTSLVQFFERHGLGKLPKTITSNQGTKSIICKSLNISFWFAYDITNDHFQPPISPRNDNYKFKAYLSSIIFTHREHSGKHPDPKPKDFWDVLPPPSASREETEMVMGPPVHINDDSWSYKLSIAEEKNLVLNYTKSSRNQLSYNSWISIRQESEIVSRVFYDRKNDFENFPFLRRAHSTIIKWLFDSRFLQLNEDVYQLPLKGDAETILDFVEHHLKNHLWKNQLVDTDQLSSFLYHITTNRIVQDPEGNRVSLYIRTIILEILNQAEVFEQIYEQNFSATDQFLNDILFDETLYSDISAVLTEKFKLFQSWKASR